MKYITITGKHHDGFAMWDSKVSDCQQQVRRLPFPKQLLKLCNEAKMRLPTIQGTIRRRILANFRVDPQVIQKQLPSRFRPKLYDGFAVAGVCMIRLDHIRPKLMPEIVGVSSENAAHRVAVLWYEGGSTREGVFISRRDSDSQLNVLLGGHISW